MDFIKDQEVKKEIFIDYTDRKKMGNIRKTHPELILRRTDTMRNEKWIILDIFADAAKLKAAMIKCGSILRIAFQRMKFSPMRLKKESSYGDYSRS